MGSSSSRLRNLRERFIWTLENAYLDKSVEFGDMRSWVKMNLAVFHRRKQLLAAYYSGILNPAFMRELAVQYHCSQAALYADWERRAKWEPLIWASQEAHEDGKALLGQLQLAREAALRLMLNPRLGDNARVAAIGRFTETVKTEIEMRQSLGLLPKITASP